MTGSTSVPNLDEAPRVGPQGAVGAAGGHGHYPGGPLHGEGGQYFHGGGFADQPPLLQQSHHSRSVPSVNAAVKGGDAATPHHFQHLYGGMMPPEAYNAAAQYFYMQQPNHNDPRLYPQRGGGRDFETRRSFGNLFQPYVQQPQQQQQQHVQQQPQYYQQQHAQFYNYSGQTPPPPRPSSNATAPPGSRVTTPCLANHQSRRHHLMRQASAGSLPPQSMQFRNPTPNYPPSHFLYHHNPAHPNDVESPVHQSSNDDVGYKSDGEGYKSDGGAYQRCSQRGRGGCRTNNANSGSRSHTPKNGYVSDGEGYRMARVRQDKRAAAGSAFGNHKDNSRGMRGIRRDNAAARREDEDDRHRGSDHSRTPDSMMRDDDLDDEDDEDGMGRCGMSSYSAFQAEAAAAAAASANSRPVSRGTGSNDRLAGPATATESSCEELNVESKESPLPPPPSQLRGKANGGGGAERGHGHLSSDPPSIASQSGIVMKSGGNGSSVGGRGSGGAGYRSEGSTDSPHHKYDQGGGGARRHNRTQQQMEDPDLIEVVDGSGNKVGSNKSRKTRSQGQLPTTAAGGRGRQRSQSRERGGGSGSGRGSGGSGTCATSKSLNSFERQESTASFHSGQSTHSAPPNCHQQHQLQHQRHHRTQQHQQGPYRMGYGGHPQKGLPPPPQQKHGYHLVDGPLPQGYMPHPPPQPMVESLSTQSSSSSASAPPDYATAAAAVAAAAAGMPPGMTIPPEYDQVVTVHNPPPPPPRMKKPAAAESARQKHHRGPGGGGRRGSSSQGQPKMTNDMYYMGEFYG